MNPRNLATNAQKIPTGVQSDVQEEAGKNGPTPEEIRQRAFEIHIESGGIHGCDLDDWLQAERELQKKYNKSSGE
jgi:hypothetical protein